jgi:hypothetical protein
MMQNDNMLHAWTRWDRHDVTDQLLHAWSMM